MFFSALPKTENSVPAPERKFTLSPVQRMYCAFLGTGGVSISSSVSGKSASGRIAEISLLFSKMEGDVSLLQAVSAVKGVKIAANVASHNKVLFFIFVLLKGFTRAVHLRRHYRQKQPESADDIVAQGRGVVNSQ